jgi:hypothetical protein
MTCGDLNPSELPKGFMGAAGFRIVAMRAMDLPGEFRIPRA